MWELKQIFLKSGRIHFLTGSNRKETDVVELGLYAGYGLSFNENHEGAIRYELSSVEYDKESVSSDLKREGNRTYFYHLKISLLQRCLIEILNYVTNLSYEKYDAEGKASSYDKYELLIGGNDKIK